MLLISNLSSNKIIYIDNFLSTVDKNFVNSAVKFKKKKTIKKYKKIDNDPDFF